MIYDLIAEAYLSLLEAMIHPESDDNGRPVKINSPHKDSPVDHWDAADRLATIVPGATHLDTHPKFAPNSDGSSQSMVHVDFVEPPLNNPSGKPLSAGVIIHEADGRVWVVHPTNQFGGYSATFPKGRVEHGLGPRETAIKEAEEESGLKVALIGHAADVERSTTFSRYYHAKRIGGHPKNMGWESQAISLVPKDQLHSVVDHPNDAALVKAARKHNNL